MIMHKMAVCSDYAQDGGEQTHALYVVHMWLIVSCKASVLPLS